MEVMCITDGWGDENGLPTNDLSISNPDYGEICKVRGEQIEAGERFFQLEGYEHNYHESGFVPLSDIDERELLEKREDKLVIV